MKKLVLILALLFFVINNSWSNKLDLDYYKPSPTKALAYSFVIPGGGYFYMSNINSKYEYKGYLFLALGIGSYIVSASQIKHGSDFNILISAVGVIVIRIIEFGAVIEDAEKERFKNMQK